MYLSRKYSLVPTIAAVCLKLPPTGPLTLRFGSRKWRPSLLLEELPPRRPKFDHIVASLAPTFATKIHDLILNHPRENPYATLKEHIVKWTSALEQQRLQQLFNAEELGDRKPSQLLCHIQQLLGDKANNTDGAFMRELFLQRLPSNVRMVLASTPDTGNLDNLTQLANKIMEVATPSVSSVHTST